jgi:hypothetical protein
MTGTSREFKYILTNDLQPIIFSAGIEHSAIAKSGYSAGYAKVRFLPNKLEIECFGESRSLNLAPKKGDEDFLALFFKPKP